MLKSKLFNIIFLYMCMVYIKSLVRISFRAADAYFVLPGSFIFYHSINVQYVRKKENLVFMYVIC